MKNKPVPPPAEVSTYTPSNGDPPTSTAGGSSSKKRRHLSVGEKFGRLVILEHAGYNCRGHNTRWLCRCDCKNKVIVDQGKLTSGHTKSCGCLIKEINSRVHRRNLLGQTFGRLTVIELAGKNKFGNLLWKCRCSCGKLTTIAGGCLTRKTTTSCGCYKFDRIRETNRAKLTGLKFGRLTVLNFVEVVKNSTRWRCKCECGQETTVVAAHLLSGNTSSCGCNKARANRARLYNPNLTDEDRIRKRRSSDPQQDSWKQSKVIFGRDNYTCLACGARGNHLAAHHILPWAQCKELRYDPANLVTLCKECHGQLHFLYGWDCDLDDFEEFLKP